MNEYTHYFVSWNGYSGGKNISFGHILISFSDKKEINLLENELYNYVLNEAQENNSEINSVHIIAFNKV